VSARATTTLAPRPRRPGIPLGLVVAALALAGCSNSHGAEHENGYGPYVAPTKDEAIEVSKESLRPFSEGMFPCSDCHDDPDLVNTTRRELTMAHQDIKLNHAEGQRWCLDCHSANDRDQLHLAGGDLVPFSESYRLCGQCHGDKYRDWKAGVHGKRIGSWNGKKEYWLCVGCHDAHNPHFKPLKPMPIPLAPRRTP